VITKLVVTSSGADTYDLFTLTGRILTAIVDLFIMLLLYKIMRLFERHYHVPKATPLWAVFCYACFVLPIQLAHFFAVDLYLTLFLFASLYYVLQFRFAQKRRFLIFSAIAFGAALSCKITAVIFGTLLILILYRTIFHEHVRRPLLLNKFIRPLGLLLLYGIVVYATLRIADPYLFQSVNPLDPRPNATFLTNLQTLKAWSNPDAWYPPGVQWLHKTPVLFALQNIAFFGLGIPLFLCMVAGVFFVIKHYRKTLLFIFVAWSGAFFLYQSTQNVKSLRYFIMIYPFFAMFAGIGWYYLTKTWKQGFIALGVFFLVLWPMLFISIYTKPHSRVQATDWIYQNLPNGSVILTEQWDDALPLRIAQPTKLFTIKEMTVFDPDTTEKWTKLDALLAQGDYLILSSNRGWEVCQQHQNDIHKWGNSIRIYLQANCRINISRQSRRIHRLNILASQLLFLMTWQKKRLLSLTTPK